MRKARVKPLEVEFMTFDEFVEYGKQAAGANIVNGMPWSFEFRGINVTHETDHLYLLPLEDGRTLNFLSGDVLVFHSGGTIVNVDFEFFKNIYDILDAKTEQEADKA